MKKVFFNPLAILVMVALTSLGCTSKFPGFDKTESGMYYKLYKVSTDTVKAKTGDFVTLEMRYTTEKDSLLFDSKVQMNGAPVQFTLPPSDFKGDIYEGMRMMSPGDSAVFIVSADSLFRKTFRQQSLPPFIDSNSVIKFHIYLKDCQPLKKLMEAEKSKIAKYMADNKITATPTESGLYYIESQKGKGPKIDTGMFVKMNFVVGTIDGNKIFSTSDRNEPVRMEYGKPFDTPGFEEGIIKMTKGSKATMIVPSELAFGAQGRGGVIAPYTALVYNVEVLDIQTKAQVDKEQADKKKADEVKKANAKQNEGKDRDAYLKAKKITAKPTASGLYYIEKVKGTGAQAMPGKKVKVHYTGTLLDGTKFDSSRDRNEPFEFTLGQGQVIKGWDEGIAKMKVGGKAILVIPSSIGYGERDMGQIPPYSTLVFDVELLGVK
ncbi:MAG TPA: FKBP-type peptidyl-prolyl cis-trans isomerase [Bacteroidales bacterium]|nr:FKBP-type peptidyl-prolyl cis-trans isomerase [Bacteroidales bacterium]HPS73328.1 FKBP-type peptidyl-prolyl cis-trans isomerase [Bacteroidales bacterium]